VPSTTVEIRGEDKTKRAFASVKKSMTSMLSATKSLGAAAAGLAGGAALGAMVTKLADVADKLGKTSARLGIGTEDLQKFRFAAEQSGVEVSTFDMALQRFTRRTAEAAEGTGVAKAALDEMGIAVRNNDGTLKSNSILLREVADAFANTTDQTQKVKLAFKLFDSEGVKMVNMLQQGSGAINAMGNQLESVGGIINNKAIKASEQFNDRLNIMAQAAKGLLTPLVELVNQGLDPFFNKLERLALPLQEQRDLIQSQINILDAERKAAEDVSFTLETYVGKIKVITASKKDTIKVTSKEITRLGALRDALDTQIAVQDAAAVSARKTAQALKAKTEKVREATQEIGYQNDVLASQYQMYAEGITMYEESALKLEESNAQKLESERLRIQEQKQLWLDEFKEYSAFVKNRRKEEDDAAAAKLKLEKATAKATIAIVAGMSGVLKGESQGMFSLYKAAAISMVFINAAEAASKAYAQLGIFGPAAAAAIYGLAIAQADLIARENFPGKQAGGDVMAGQPYLVGERGPELFTPGQTGSIAPNRNSGQGVIINIYDGTGRKINQAMSDLRVEVVERANSFGQFAALESPLYTDAAAA